MNNATQLSFVKDFNEGIDSVKTDFYRHILWMGHEVKTFFSTKLTALMKNLWKNFLTKGAFLLEILSEPL